MCSLKVLNLFLLVGFKPFFGYFQKLVLFKIYFASIILGLGGLKKWKNYEIKYLSVRFSPAIVKINICKVQLPNFHKIKYTQNLVRIRYILKPFPTFWSGEKRRGKTKQAERGWVVLLCSHRMTVIKLVKCNQFVHLPWIVIFVLLVSPPFPANRASFLSNLSQTKWTRTSHDWCSNTTTLTNSISVFSRE